MSNNVNPNPSALADAIYQDMTPEQRLAKLRDSADQVVKHSFQRPYSDEKISEIRTEISDLCVKISDFERELAAIKASYKSTITPLETDRERLIGDLRSGGEYVTEECFVFMNFDIGKAGLYTKDGILINEADITQEMSQSTIFQTLREAPEIQDNEPALLPAPEEE